ncbi:hypothetical protein TGCAST_207730 [Toxoplasma gondii CAST]|uniref:Protein kinase domain-containing protein n=1 Tax=Toxoplasma gondii CAST TaxID=943122 RepID=A0A3R8B1B1_TOXGO|nr:hypothetical protein TGCAST_207730 [Toxoplasma gondii CAST]
MRVGFDHNASGQGVCHVDQRKGPLQSEHHLEESESTNVSSELYSDAPCPRGSCSPPCITDLRNSNSYAGFGTQAPRGSPFTTLLLPTNQKTNHLMSTQSPEAPFSAAELTLTKMNTAMQAAFPAAENSVGPAMFSPKDATEYSIQTGIPRDISSLETACTPDAQTPQFRACELSPQAGVRDPHTQKSAKPPVSNPTLRCLRIGTNSRERKTLVGRQQPTEKPGSTSFWSHSKQGEARTGAVTRGEILLAEENGLDVNRKRRVSQADDNKRRVELLHNSEARAFPTSTNTGNQRRHGSPALILGHLQDVVPGSDVNGSRTPSGMNFSHLKVRSFVPFQFQAPHKPGNTGEHKGSCAETRQVTLSRGYHFESQRWDDTRILPLKGLIGSGAMGHVYLVEIDDQQYALKLAVQSDPAACMYLRHGWRNLTRLESMYLTEELEAVVSTGEAQELSVEQKKSTEGEVEAESSDPTRSCPFGGDGTSTHTSSVQQQIESKKATKAPRYFCKPLAFLEGDWIRFRGGSDTGQDVQISEDTTTGNSSASQTPRVTPICAYIMEYIPNACQLTAFIWNFHRTSDLSQLLRASAYPQGTLAAKRLVDLSIHVATAHKIIACKAGMVSFDFNPKNILVNVELPACISDRLGATGQSPVLSAAEITRTVLCDPVAKFRVVAIDLDCSLRAPFSSANEDNLLLDWSCGRRVVYSCPHVSSITAAYILAVLAKNKGEGQFARSGLKETVAHNAICQRIDDKCNFLHYMWSEKNVTNSIQRSGVANRSPSEKYTSRGQGAAATLPSTSDRQEESTRVVGGEARRHHVEERLLQRHKDEPFVSELYLPCFLYPRERLPRDVSQKEYRKYGVRLVGHHVNMQLLAFILCELLDFKSLHVVVLQKFTPELRLLELPTDICRMFSEQDQIISCLCFSALTKMKSATTTERSGIHPGDFRKEKPDPLRGQLNDNLSRQPSHRAPPRCTNQVRKPLAEDTIPALSHPFPHSARTANSVTCFSPDVGRPRTRRFLRMAGVYPLAVNKTGNDISRQVFPANRTAFAFFRKEHTVASYQTPPGQCKKAETPRRDLNFREGLMPDSFAVTAGFQRVQNAHQNSEPPPSVSSEESVVAGSCGRQAAIGAQENDKVLKGNRTLVRNSTMSSRKSPAADELKRLFFTAEEVSNMSVWEKVEALPALSPQDFLPSVDLFGRRCREEMSSLNSVLLEFLDPHPYYVLHNYNSPELAFDNLVQSLRRLSQRISS